MMHITDGQWRAYYDDELGDLELARVEAHLSACTACQQEAQGVLGRAERVSSFFAALDLPAEPLPSRKRAHAKLRVRLSETQKERITMWTFFQKYRTAWTGLAAALLLAFALAFPSVRALASDFLGLFRVKQVTILEFDPNDVGDQIDSSALPGGRALSDNIEMEEVGETQEVASAAEASQVANIAVRLPSNMQEAPSLIVKSGANISLEIDQPRAQALLDAVGQDVELPESLNGAVVNAQLPQAVIAAYGEECQMDIDDFKGRDKEAGDKKFSELTEEERRELKESRQEEMRERRGRHSDRDCTTMIQLPSPTVSAPPELPVVELGSAFLQLMGMNPDEAAQFSADFDWSTTLLIPVPQGETEHSDVSVDGVTGTLIQGAHEFDESYMLIWVKDDIMHTINGSGDASQAIEMANSLQ